jgi:hypothetical protein
LKAGRDDLHPGRPSVPDPVGNRTKKGIFNK